jgi:hypothetical protein
MQQGQQQQSLPAWAEVYSRQVRSLPQGVTALHNLLRAVEHLLTKADNCGHHSGVMKAYLGLGLIDITSQAWKQRTAQLQEQQDKVRPVVILQRDTVQSRQMWVVRSVGSIQVFQTGRYHMVGF